MKTFFSLFLTFLFFTSALIAQSSSKPLKPKINSMQKTTTRPKDKRMGLGSRDMTEKIENNEVAEAFVELKSGNVEQATKQFEKYSQQDLDAAFGYGLALHQQGYTKEAIKVLEEVILKDPDHTDAMYELASIYFESDNYPKAEEYYLSILRLDPEDDFTWEDLGFLYTMVEGLESQAIYCFKQVIKLDPEYADPHFEIARIYALTGHDQDAIKQLQLACKKKFEDMNSISEDEDFKSLHELPEFNSLMEKCSTDEMK
ncbi:MAG: tetratricopeptide repeat protein [Saprospiraceae bacterium]|nr:tetratricopeptide repeat protein [Candidatus Vicinibacter affinis]